MSQCAVWELRMNSEGVTVKQLKDQLKKIAKKWVFQLEQGSKTGYKHYQGRISLFKKATKKTALKLFVDIPAPQYFEPTTTADYTKEGFYCMKEQTRLEGPYKDDDKEPPYIPVQYRHIKESQFYPYQKAIFNNEYFNYRTVNYVVDKGGNLGKSTIACLTTQLKDGLYIPPMNDAQKLVEFVYCQLEQYKDGETPKVFIIDLPRSMSKDCLFGMFSAIEQFKTGYIYDTRYKGRSRWIDSPNIWVFTNEDPDLSRLSRDRWNILKVNDEKEFEKYTNLDIQIKHILKDRQRIKFTN